MQILVSFWLQASTLSEKGPKKKNVRVPTEKLQPTRESKMNKKM